MLCKQLVHGKAFRFTGMAVPKQQLCNLVFRRIKKRGRYALHTCQVLRC